MRPRRPPLLVPVEIGPRFDLISAYGQMPGWLNLSIHDYYYGGSPFGALDRYLSISPSFHLSGLTTPVLLEFGDQSLAMRRERPCSVPAGK
ncbi:MAG: hypothetical protein HY650_12745 [Acidobacteria bacterium]|nr:hypothetical protein [Acidobacteriota bacterium]